MTINKFDNCYYQFVLIVVPLIKVALKKVSSAKRLSFLKLTSEAEAGFQK